MSRFSFIFILSFIFCLFISNSYGLGAGSFFGIDFGCESFKVMILHGNAPDIVLNDQSGRKSPTLVGFSRDGERVFGSRATQLKSKFPNRVISSPHEFLGKNYPDSQIENSRHLYPFDLVNNNGSYGFQIDDNIYTPEEIVAMIIEYAKDMASSVTNGNKFTDIVIVIPPYLTQLQRQGFVNAAKIAGLNVLQLANEGTATAVQYLRSRLLGEENIDQYTIIYNVGAAHSSATLTRFHFDKLSNGTINRKIIANMTKWGDIGGRDFDYRISQYVKNIVEKEFNTDISNNLRVLERINKESKKAKEVLSANKEVVIRMESLLNDKDFSCKITRQEFEEMCLDLFENVMKPINDLLEETTIPLENIDIEVIGGGSRIVKINDFLINKFTVDKVGRHLNGDESSLQGACIFAATSSAGKRSSIIIKDTYNHEVTVEFDIDDVEPSILFKPTSRLNSYKNKNVFADSDFNCKLYYTNAEYLSSGISFNIGGCSITNFPDLSSYNLTDTLPTVKIKFEIDNRGLIIYPEAFLRIEYYMEKEKPKTISIDLPEELNNNNKTIINEETIENNNIEEKENQEDNDNNGDNDNNEDNNNINEGDNQQLDENENNNDITNDNDNENDNIEIIYEAKKKYFELTITKHNMPNELNYTQISSSRSLLAKLKRDDKQRLLLAETKNELESFVYSTLDILENESVRQYATEDELEKYTNELLEAGDWIYEDGRSATLEEYQEKLNNLKETAYGIQLRMTERFDQPEIINEFNEWKNTTLFILETIVQDKMVDEEERDSILSDIQETEQWIEEKQIEQESKQLTDDPAWKSSELKSKLQVLQNSLKRLTRRRSRTPTPSPSPSKENDENNNNNNENILYENINFEDINFGEEKEKEEEPIKIENNEEKEENKDKKYDEL